MYLEIILFSYFMLTGVKKYIRSSYGKCRSNKKLTGKTVIITGANSGLGKATALDIANRGARVILACRNIDAANATREEIIYATDNDNIVVHHIDFESLDSIRNFSKKIHATEERIDILINNAGASQLGSKVTKDGLNIAMQVNHFAPFLLTNLLLDLLKNSSPSRIVNVSSRFHKSARLNLNNLNEPASTDIISYSNTKLCNLLMSNVLSRRLAGTGVTSNCSHPGFVDTNICKHMSYIEWLGWKILAYLFFRTPKEGAQTTINLAVSEDLEKVSGKYFANCELTTPSKQAEDDKLADKIWELSEQAVGLMPDEKHF